jgi:membrane protease YdiL (CAAX protease family)
MPWDFALIFVILAVIVPWRGTLRVRELLRRPSLSTSERLSLYLSPTGFHWLAAATILWRWRARGLHLAGLGMALPAPQLSGLLAAGLSAGLAALQIRSFRRIAGLPSERQGFIGELARRLMPHNRTEWLVFVPLTLSVALCEEWLYRGFALAALETASHSLVLAALGSSLLFAAAHLYQGGKGLLATFAVGLVFAGARLLARSLVPSIAAHFVADLLAAVEASRRRAGTWPPATLYIL